MADQEQDWTLSIGAQPIFWSVIFAFTCLTIVSFPNHINRWTAISMLLVTTYAAFKTSGDFSPDYKLNDIYMRYLIIVSSHILSMIYKNNGSNQVPSHLDHKDAKATWNPWYRGYKLLYNVRGVATPWENPYLWPGIKHTWLASKSSADVQTKDPKQVTRHNLTARGKWMGVAIRCGYLLINFFLIACFYEFLGMQNLLATEPSDFIRDKEGIIRRLLRTCIGRSQPTTPVARREFEIRAVQAFGVVTEDYLLLSMYHDFCALVFISLGLDESWEWPPLFGRISEAYTMRGWWSLWWHRLIYRSFNSHTAVVTGALGIKQRGAFYRALNAFVVFGLSGVMHATVTWKMGSSCAWGRSIFYWFLQPVAFMIEGVVQFYWGKIRQRIEGKVNSKVLGAFELAVGYSWVCAWRLWDTSKQTFALARCEG